MIRASNESMATLSPGGVRPTVGRISRRGFLRSNRALLAVTAVAMFGAIGVVGVEAQGGPPQGGSAPRGSSGLAADVTAKSCSYPSVPAGQGARAVTAGRVEIPVLGLDAPVLQGDGPSQLSLAVGHAADTVWPGSMGTTVLASVGGAWFSRIGSLTPGDEIVFVAACVRYTYSVTATSIVNSQSPIPSGPAVKPVFSPGSGDTPGLVLVTTAPTNALWATQSDYRVTATLSAIQPTGWTSLGGIALPQAPAVSMPPGMGSLPPLPPAPPGILSFQGTPNSSWAQSLGPVAVAEQVRTLYQAAVVAADGGGAPQWVSLSANKVPFAVTAGLKGTKITYLSRVKISLRVNGSNVVAASAQAIVKLSGGHTSGPHILTIGEAVRANHLNIAGFSLAAPTAAVAKAALAAPPITPTTTTTVVPSQSPLSTAAPLQPGTVQISVPFTPVGAAPVIIATPPPPTTVPPPPPTTLPPPPPPTTTTTAPPPPPPTTTTTTTTTTLPPPPTTTTTVPPPTTTTTTVPPPTTTTTTMPPPTSTTTTTLLPLPPLGG